MLRLVKSCFNKGPYSSQAEAKVVADDATAGGYTASVITVANGWMVKVCKK